MKVAGIIAEYNPFHNGHLHQIHQLKRIYQPDYIVVAMSGDFVQRGEPAILDKYARTRMALAWCWSFLQDTPLPAPNTLHWVAPRS